MSGFLYALSFYEYLHGVVTEETPQVPYED